MNLQNYLLCTLYILLIITHSFTLAYRDFHTQLILVFSAALLTQTFSTVLFTIHQALLSHSQHLVNYIDTESDVIYKIHHVGQWLHIVAINFFILFLLIVAKGWPITRREMPFKYAFAMFWLLCFASDLITFYWSACSAPSRDYGNHQNSSKASTPSVLLHQSGLRKNSTNEIIVPPIDERIRGDVVQFNGTPRRLSLLIRVIIMLYFLLELRTTMILEQEQKKLQFYLHFGALSMVWFVHSLIVYVISLRVEVVWQSKLISGFSSVADFLAFVFTARLLWPKSSNSSLFRKKKFIIINEYCEDDQDNLSALNSISEKDDAYDGLEMRDLTSH